MTHTSTEQLEPRYADVVHHANVHPSLSYVARKTGLGYQETTRLLELALARGDLASGDYAGRNLDLYVADREKALTQEVEQLRARVQELETGLKKANAQAEHFEREWYLRGDELEAQVQRAPLTDAQIKEGRNAVNDDPDDRPEPWAFREGVKFAERMHGITQEKQE